MYSLLFHAFLFYFIFYLIIIFWPFIPIFIFSLHIDVGILTRKAAKVFFDITAKARVRIRSVCESNEDSETPSNNMPSSQTSYKEIECTENVVSGNVSVESFEIDKNEDRANLTNDVGTKKTNYNNFGIIWLKITIWNIVIKKKKESKNGFVYQERIITTNEKWWMVSNLTFW